MANLFGVLCLLGPAVYGFVRFGWLNAVVTLVGAFVGAFVVNMMLAAGARISGRYHLSGEALRWSAALAMLAIGMTLSSVIG